MNEETRWLEEIIPQLIRDTATIAVNVDSLRDRIAALEDKVARLEQDLRDHKDGWALGD